MSKIKAKTKNGDKKYIGAWIDKNEYENFKSQAKQNNRKLPDELRHRMKLALAV